MIQGIIKYLIMFAGLVLVQVLVLNHIQFSGFINPYVYILFVMLLPLNMPRYLILPLAFLIGITVDIFSNSIGIHAASTTLVAYVRPAIIRLISNRDEERSEYPGLKQNGFTWFLYYTVALVLIHQFALFYLEVFTFDQFFKTFLRVLLSSFFSIFIIVLSQYIIFRE